MLPTTYTRHRSAVDCQIGYKFVYIHGIPVPKFQEKTLP